MSNPPRFASHRSRAAACVLAGALLLAAAPASATTNIGDAAENAGLGLAAGTCTVLYLPFKAFIAANGFLIGGAAWALTGGDREPAMTILDRTAGGDWLVTQQHLRGDRPFYVLAQEPRAPIARAN